MSAPGGERPRGDHAIASVVIEERGIVRYHPDVERERAVAIYDLVEERSHFRPMGDYTGPYRLHLSVSEGRLHFDIRDNEDRPLCLVRLSLRPFRRIIKDYFAVCESYYEAIRSASLAQIEAIDMGRRGLHNEGSECLIAGLAGQIELDMATARRLFTLICVMHIRE